MLFKTIIAAATLTQAVQAHFTLNYPTWRGDSFEEPASQWIRPCAGINTTTESDNNRTAWPLDGGSLSLKLGHAFDYVFINLGIGSEVTNFNISLTPNFYNNTGNGTLCLPKVAIPAGIVIEDGQEASIQVVAMGRAGNSMYNCADIVFSSNATILEDEQCQNTTTGPLFVVEDASAEGNDTAGDAPSAATHTSVSVLTASFTVLMAMIVASGLL
ncbi:hypothetical protein ABW19_dt0203304 [Dactylella cylindrospora]|nr:hypothetical protein ABW19_dt0203304 [Dactylella cylindrospora]